MRFFRDFCFRCDLIFLVAAGFSRLRTRRGGMKTDEVCDRPLDPFGCTRPYFLGYRCRTELIRLRRMKSSPPAIARVFQIPKISKKSAKNCGKNGFSLDKGCFLYYSCIQSANKMHFASADVLTRKDTNAADSKPPTRSCSLWQPSPFSP